ncbi:MAG TPA: aldo/keto reductase [Bacillota bacterium]|nr:aldo/keto reductase [Bacillota bacterium]
MVHIPEVTLSNGVKIPQVGLGVYQVTENDIVSTVQSALENGYRHIDTASFYDNEVGVGEAVKNSNLNREELFITSKVWNDEQGYEETLAAYERSITRLGTDYLDLYLIHWPMDGTIVETWKALEYLYENKKVRAIGVSNFLPHHLEEIMEVATVRPMINQIELHPKLIQKEAVDYCEANDIVIQSWSPIGRARYLDDPLLVTLAEKYDKSAAQIILRWHLAHNYVIIPRSTNHVRQLENLQLFDFELTNKEIAEITALHTSEDRIGSHPDDMAKKQF